MSANEPRFHYPDFKFDVSKGNAVEGPGDIELYFGKSRIPIANARQGMPIDALTLQAGYEGSNSFIANIMHYNFVGVGGWWTDLLPLKRVETLNQQWVSYEFERQAMEPAPEETVPRLVQFKRRDHTETLTRFSIGGKAYGDFYKTADGKAAMEAQMGQMISGGWITAKLLVSSAVFSAKLEYEEYRRQHGPIYTQAMDALRDEIDYFGALSKDERGIYKLQGYVDAVTKDASPQFDMIIVAKGALNFVALSGSYETESYRRGQSVVEKRLSLGARSLLNVFPGITIYEDEVFSLNNVGPDEINQFTRIAIIGRYFMIDGSEFGRHLSSYPAHRMLSCDAVSLSIDDWYRWDINRVIDKDMRWNPDDTLSDSVKTLAANVDSTLQRSGVRLHNERLVDPYIWMAEDGSYHPIEHWGDMDTAYFSVEQTQLHGEMAAKNILAKLTPTQKDSLNNLKSLKNRLFTVPDILDESFQAYVFAVTANPENRNGPADFSGHNSYMLKANKFGFSQPPHVDKAPKRSNNMGGPEVDYEHGALYIKVQGDRRFYIWVLYPETLEENNRHTIRRSEPLLFEEGSNSVNSDLVYPAANASEAYNSFTAFSQPDIPYALVAAPIDAFGPIDVKGTAPWFDRHIPADAQFHSIAYRRLRAVNVGPEARGGIKPPRLVRAPPQLIGYGVPAGIDTIGQLHAEGDCRGWNPVECNGAFTGSEVKNTVGRILVNEYYPECILASDKYTPYYMKSAYDSERNKINSVFASLWDQVRYPIWCRIPKVTDALSRTGEKYIALVTDLREAKGVSRGIDSQGISGRAGFTVIGGILRLKTSNENTVEVEKSAEIQELFGDIINSPFVDPNILNILKDSQPGGAASKLFASYSSSNKSGLGQAYATHLDAVHGIKNASHDFAWFISKELRLINFRSGINSAVKVFNTVLGIALVAMNGPAQKRYSADSLAGIIIAAESLGKTPMKNVLDDNAMDAEEAIGRAEADSPPSSSTPFINTRLAIDPEAFLNLFALVENADANDFNVLRAAHSIIRPSDPRNGGKPAAAYHPGEGPADLSIVKQSESSFQYARAGAPRGLARTSLLHESLLVINDDASDISPYSHKRKRNLPDSIINDTVGPLYDDVSRKQFLVRRFEELSDSMSEDDLGRMAAQMLCLTPVTKTSLKTLIKKNLPPPISCYIIAQPWIRIRTSAGIWARKGIETGNIAYNFEDVNLQYNGRHKTWHMHYTIWMNAAIFDPLRLLILKDIKFEGYIGGMDETVNDENDLNTWDPTAVDFARVKSSFIFSCGSLFTRSFARLTANPLSLFGKYDPRSLPVNFADRNRMFNPDAPLWPSFLYYNMLWGFTDMNNNSPPGAPTYQGCRESSYISGLMPMATHKIYDPNTGDWTKVIDGTGHLDCLKPPMLQVLSGKVKISCDKK